MKLGIARFGILTAIVGLAVLMGNTTARAQCPSSPNYYPDFTSNESCLTLNSPSPNPYPGYPGFYSVITPPQNQSVATVLRLTPNETFTSGSAWFTAQQPVGSAFSTTFIFEISDPLTFNADGLAFVIQNSSTTALDTGGSSDGCGIGYGEDNTGCSLTSGGIPNSLAIEFDTYQNEDDPNNNHVAIQSCGTAANSSDNLVGGVIGMPEPCNLAINANLPITLADGNPHTVTITYAPSSLSNCPAIPSGPQQGSTYCSTLDVIVDGTDLFPGGVQVNLSTLLSLNSGNAWVGFTAATGGGDDLQDILSWTFTPGAQSGVLSMETPTTLTFANASGSPAYSFNGQLTSPTDPTMMVQPIPISQAACDKLVQVNFFPARCFNYESALNASQDSAIMFAVTCPGSPGGTCGSTEDADFFAVLGTSFQFAYAQNSLFAYPGIIGPLNPFPGWLKGGSGTSPCTVPASGPLFLSNQVISFVIDKANTQGNSGGTGSCWVATYDTPGEIWPAITISSPTVTTSYPPSTAETATFTCNNPLTSQPLSSPTGPYLSAASCQPSPSTGTPHCTFTATQGPANPGGLACTSSFVTPAKSGVYAFAVTAIDSGGNQNVNVVLYKVK
jgi:Legume lectin domain